MKISKQALQEIIENAINILEKKNKVNPWAVCTDSTGRDDKAKYERCVKKVKSKQGIDEQHPETAISKVPRTVKTDPQAYAATRPGKGPAKPTVINPAVDTREVNFEEFEKIRSLTDKIETMTNMPKVKSFANEIYFSLREPQKISFVKNYVDEILDLTAVDEPQVASLAEDIKDILYKIDRWKGRSVPTPTASQGTSMPAKDLASMSQQDIRRRLREAIKKVLG